MNETLSQLEICIEAGKVNKSAPYPPSMRDKDGADELTKRAIAEGVPVSDILNKALIQGMYKVGVKFSQNKAFVPELLMAAKAMNTAMLHLKPFFQSGEIQRKGTLVIGTVVGDLHDIGKKLVGMMIEGAGWEVIDLGVDVKPEKFIAALEKHPGCVVGLSALLTTTMVNMEKIVKQIKEKAPQTKVLIGGAPLSQAFCDKIGADFYSNDPYQAIEYLNKLEI